MYAGHTKCLNVFELFGTIVYTSQLYLPVLAGKVGDLVWHVYISVPYPVLSRVPFNFPVPDHVLNKKLLCECFL